jgi:TolB-like protein/DNA-binding winged helix-turn-helix (wHTH) protein/Tfp pilus assembly protein PilF
VAEPEGYNWSAFCRWRFVLAGSFSVGDWRITPELNSLERAGHSVRVEPKIMQVLVTLAEHPGEVVSKEQLLRRVWPDTFVSDEVLMRSVSELRKAFEDNPREPTYIQTIPKGGYRLVARVAWVALDHNDRGGAHGLAGKAWALGTALGIALLGIGAFFFLRYERRAAPQPEITSLAVLPLVNLSGDAGQDYFADGMTDELTTRLSGIKALRVVSRTSAMHYKGTGKTPSETARELNVDALVAGSVVRSGGRVRISAQLVQATTGSNLWAESYERDLRDVLALQADVARTIADQIKIQVTPQERRKLLAAATVNSEAHDSYLKGIYYWNKFTEPGMRRAVDYFEEAIGRDPNYAPAYAGLAHAYHQLAYYTPPNEVMPKAKRAAIRALQLDDTNAEAHAALGWIISHYDWDWPGAEVEYRRALDANPGSALVHALYAIYLDTMGRVEEGIREHKVALELDPLWLADITCFGDAYLLARRYDEAIEQYQKALEMDASFAIAHAGLGATYLQKGEFGEAIAHFQKATQLDTDPGFAAGLAFAYARSGNRKEARTILNRLLAAAPKSYISSAGVAAVYSAIGEPDQSCKWLQRAYEAHDSALVYIHVAPEWDGLRSNHCFQGLIQRMGFPQALSNTTR